MDVMFKAIDCITNNLDVEAINNDKRISQGNL